jgi:hypothetical protein
VPVNNQLLAVNDRARRRQNPRERLPGQAEHPIAFRTLKVDMIAPALAEFPSVQAKPSDSIRALDPMDQARALQSLERTVDRHPVESASFPASFKDVLGRKRLPGSGKQLQDSLPGCRPSEAARFQKLHRRFHGHPRSKYFPSLFFMQLCCK